MKDLLEHDDILDATSSLHGLRCQVDEIIQKSGLKHAQSLQTGRKRGHPGSQQIDTLKKRLRMSREQDKSLATKALEKLEKIQQEEVERTESLKAKAPPRRKQAKKRRPRKRAMRYKRMAGDELRLIKKREIAT